jgi:uncharacterized LabA/DUF88 family protein
MPDEEKKPTAARTRRGSRGGRARTPKAAGNDGESLSAEPRVVRRRPSASSAAAEEAQPQQTATTRRRRQPAAAKEEPAKAESTAEQKTPRRGRRPAAAAAEQAAPAGDDAQPKRTPRRRSAAREAASDGAAPADLASLGEAVADVRRAVDELSERVERFTQRARLGVFVDVPNVLYGAERGDAPIDMGKLLDYLADGREVVRATAYSPVSDDPSEPVERQRFVAPFVPHEYRIVTKPLKRFADGSIKGNFDVEMAIDMLTMAERLDVIACVSGDSDFARLVEVIQGRGVRVEVVAFAGSTSTEMRALADRYIELGAIADQLRS